MMMDDLNIGEKVQLKTIPVVYQYDEQGRMVINQLMVNLRSISHWIICSKEKTKYWVLGYVNNRKIYALVAPENIMRLS